MKKLATLFLLGLMAGVLSAQTKVSPQQGGTGVDSSHATGCAYVTAGVWTFLGGGCGGGGGSITSITATDANGFDFTITNPAGPTVNIGLAVDVTHYLPTTTDQTNWDGKVAATPPLTTTYMPKANGAASIADSSMYDDTTKVHTGLPFEAASAKLGSGAVGCGVITGCFAVVETAGTVTPTATSAIFNASSVIHRVILSLNGDSPLSIPRTTAVGTPTNCWLVAANGYDMTSGSCAGTSGVASINSTAGAFTFTGGGVSCVTTTCTFSGGGGGSPAGSNTQVQYNASGSFGANSGFTSDTSGNVVVNSLTSATSIATGSIASCVVNGIWCAIEAGTAGTPAATVDYIRADSTAHAYRVSLNNVAEFDSLMNYAAVTLSGSQVTGQLPIGKVGSAGLSGTSPMAISAGGAISINTNGITASQLAAQYSKGSCTEAWGGSGASFALTAGDDAVSNNTCYNDSGVTRTITAVKCRASGAANTTTVNPTMGSAGTGTTILSGALTCGSSYAYSSTGTVSSASWTTGTGITPAMGGTLTGTSIAMIIEFTY